ncbi:MAG: TetR family transcriptional regulator [Dehalococcoidia bacterium]|nr:TetR family transcriptional regulator [Dehalococcoidia bacterium]
MTIARLKSAAGQPRDSRYELILNTAAELIHEKGYHAVTMRDLARAVGIKMPSVYHHFESKEQILYAIAVRTMRTLIDRTMAVLDVLDARNVQERLSAAIRISVRFHIEHQAEAGVVLSEVRNLGGANSDEVRQLMKDYEAIFYGLVVQGIKDGVFARRDPTMATYIILSALTRISIWYRPGGRLPAQAVEEEYAALLQSLFTPLLANPTAGDGSAPRRRGR